MKRSITLAALTLALCGCPAPSSPKSGAVEAKSGASDAHAGHDHGAHDHAGHDHAGHDHAGGAKTGPAHESEEAKSDEPHHGVKLHNDSVDKATGEASGLLDEAFDRK